MDEPQQQEQPPSTSDAFLHTIDGEEVLLEEARRLSRNLFLAGFAMLPWAWALNAWLFYPVAFGSGSGSGNNQNSNSSFIDPVVRRNARRSAAGAAVAGVALLAWASAFSLGGPRAVGKATFERLNLGDLDLDAWGLRF